jgi:HlyD family secretion protein
MNAAVKSDTVERETPTKREASIVAAPPLTPSLAATEEVLSDDPKRERRWGWTIAIAFFGVLGGFSLIARLDAAVYAQGAIAVSGNRQAVQHKDGGVVSALHVREGQKVRAGDVLIELAPADVGAAAASMQSQLIGLQARRARLIAEATHLGTVAMPIEFANLAPPAKLEADRAMMLQRAEMAARRTSLARQKAVLNQRAAQLNQQIIGLRGQAASTEDQRRLIGEELVGIRSLAERGFASQNQVRALERSEAGLAGQNANLTAGAAQARAQIGETRAQAQSLDSQFDEQIAQELREVELALADLLPKYAATRERLAGTSIRAPASGQVVGLNAFTVGGVIAPGQAVMEIVPDAAPMVVQAQISPADADDVHLGQATEVRLVSLSGANVPTLHGAVTAVSADRLVDPKSGYPYFTAQVTVPAAEFAKVRKIKGAETSVRVGLPVEVLVPLRKRTAFQYMTEPLTRVFWRSFREH